MQGAELFPGSVGRRGGGGGGGERNNKTLTVWQTIVKLRQGPPELAGAISPVDMGDGQVVKSSAKCLEEPLFVTAHTFCATRDTRVSYGWCLPIQGYFCARFKTMRRKQN